MRAGTDKEKVYNCLLTHEYMKPETIIKKTNVPQTSLSTALTHLRRAGLVEYSGHGRMRLWKKHPIDKPLYPPQKDIVNRKKKSAQTTELHPTVEQRIERVFDLQATIIKELDKIKTECKNTVFVECGEMNGEKIFRKERH